MTFGVFKYQTDAGIIGRIRMREVTFDASSANVEPAGVVDDRRVWAYVSKRGRRRDRAIGARGLILSRRVGTAPNTFNRYSFVPFCTPAGLAAFNADTLTVGGVVWQVAGVMSEA